jgi:pyruvate dehydrogenase E1 component alpha subunit
MIEEIFRRMCEIRYFDLEVIKAHKKGLIHCPVYLSLGQEAVAASISVICPEYKIFPQHRGHAWYLAYGGSPDKLRNEILGFETGCCQGKGGSSDIQSDKVEAHHGLIGEQVPIGVGYALAARQPIIIQAGDGAVEEDCFLTSVGFASTHKLPVLFICEDNGLAILTPIKDRRSWNIVSAVRGLGIDALDLEDDPITLSEIDIRLPMLLNIKTTRHYWHVGIGQDNPPERDRIAQYRNIKHGEEIEKEAKEKMERLWQL